MTMLDHAIGLEERARAYYAEAAKRIPDSSGKSLG